MFIHLNTIFTQRVVEGINVRITLYTYLSNHDREGEDSNKVVDKLEDNLKQGGGVRQTANGDEGLHRKVVTANVTEQRQSKAAWEKGRTRKLLLIKTDGQENQNVVRLNEVRKL